MKCAILPKLSYSLCNVSGLPIVIACWSLNFMGFWIHIEVYSEFDIEKFDEDFFKSHNIVNREELNQMWIFIAVWKHQKVIFVQKERLNIIFVIVIEKPYKFHLVQDVRIFFCVN